MRSRDYVVAAVLVTAIAAVACAALTWRLHRHRGLIETVSVGAAGEARILATRRTAAIDLSILDDTPGLPRQFFSAHWTGAWRVPASAFYRIGLAANDHAAFSVDGEVVQEASVAHATPDQRVVWLAAGFHDVDVQYTQLAGIAALALSATRPGQVPHAIGANELVAAKPTHPALESLLERLRAVLFILVATVSVLALYLAARRAAAGAVRAVDRRVPRPIVLRAARAAVLVLAASAVLYGAYLRFDALTLTYGPVTGPRWLSAIQREATAHGALRPDSFDWTPATGHYISDPYTYLQYARAMQSFYAAHRREPMFPFVTKVFLGLLGGQDVAVSFASASFSVLAIVATYLLGARAFSPWVGLAAALGMAIEHDVIAWSIGGWRDDAFTCAVVLSAWAMLRYARAPSVRNGALLGTIAGCACLIRITSLSFLVPGFAFLALTTGRPFKQRALQLGAGVLLLAAIAGPFLVNCWLTFGDPLYSINVHADVYRDAEGGTNLTHQTAGSYLLAKVRERPAESLDTAILGMTSYPFVNKWSGFDPWSPAMGPILSIAAVAGLLLFAGSSAGRLLLLVLATSLLPYVLTWRLISDWRFTEHAYPFFLIAAFLAIGRIAALLVAPRAPRWPDVIPWGRGLAAGALILGSIAAATWVLARGLPFLSMKQSLAAGADVTVMAGGRDGAFFLEGWSEPLVEGNVTARVSRGAFSVIRLPLPRVADYDVTVRLDPFPRPLMDRPPVLPTVAVFLNGQAIAALPVRWSAIRVGAYDIRLPKAAVRVGVNRLSLMVSSRAGGVADPGVGQTAVSTASDPRFRLWYVRIHAPLH